MEMIRALLRVETGKEGDRGVDLLLSTGEMFPLFTMEGETLVLFVGAEGEREEGVERGETLGWLKLEETVGEVLTGLLFLRGELVGMGG